MGDVVEVVASAEKVASDDELGEVQVGVPEEVGRSHTVR
jgi:hypothetical protein